MPEQYVEPPKCCQPGLKTMVNSMIDDLFPWSCVLCGLSCEPGGICGYCRRQLPDNADACHGCGLPLAATAERICGACLGKPRPYEFCFAPYRYSFPLDRLLHRFKFNRNAACGRALGEVFLSRILEFLEQDGSRLPDLWVPVPMHRWRLLRRLVNPAFELARDLGKATGAGLAIHELRRNRNTKTQTGLKAAERRRNLRKAFSWKGRALTGLHVGIVDDVMTTGSTFEECTKVLKKEGAEQVSAWTLARAVANS